MTEKDIAEMTTRIVVALIEQEGVKLMDYVNVMRVYDAVNKQVARSAAEAREMLRAPILEAKQ